VNWIRTIIGVVLTGFGLLWFLQGINLVPGSFMSGSTFWAIVGPIAALAGLGVLSYRPKSR
jgi:hypothetical protein